jgi:hypothetical protein
MRAKLKNIVRLINMLDQPMRSFGFGNGVFSHPVTDGPINPFRAEE